MIKFRQLFQAYQAYQVGKLGDAAILKADAFGATINPQVAAKMQAVVGYYPSIDLEALLKLPENTFGYQYALHMKEANLKPFNVSPEMDEIAKRNVFALRYAVTHDIFHTLLGFDTSYAGEIGVLAFAVAQNYSKFLGIGLAIAKILYPILAPRQIQASFANIHKGTTMGKQVDFLLGYPFEAYWEKPLAEVKAELGFS
ncbi:MAG: Coq4 family protein [Oscillatoria sp. PMC 1068.18]|nr:Coq4 family protein [Oscillatoria sp. PMC 1076.18]MEC4989516.1 Coq4 family protein [Oscillatoria sp. PMC 1068.18]